MTSRLRWAAVLLAAVAGLLFAGGMSAGSAAAAPTVPTTGTTTATAPATPQAGPATPSAPAAPTNPTGEQTSDNGSVSVNVNGGKPSQSVRGPATTM